MRVFLTSAYAFPTVDHGPRWLRNHARAGLQYVVERPEDADIILFVECYQPTDPFFRKVHVHPIFQKQPEKCLLYHSADASVPFCRTLTPSNDRRFAGGGTRRTFHYIARLYENGSVDEASTGAWNPRFLYSFQGARTTHVVRGALLAGTHPEGVMVDNGTTTHHMVTEAKRLDFEKRYVELIQASRFVLCPRGFGPCTYRLFETMQLGRVPVIISDDWTPIPGIPWEQCSLSIKEDEVAAVPDILSERRADAEEMGRMARETWERYFSPIISLERLLVAAEELAKRPYGPMEYLAESRNLLRDPFWKIIVTGLRDRLMRKNHGHS